MRKRSFSELLPLLLVAVLALSLLPLLALAPYALPCADDFNFSIDTHDVLLGGGSALEMLRASLQTVRSIYGNWQGTFSAIFLMTLQPGIWGERFYALTPVLMLAALLGGTFVLCIAAARRLFGLSRGLGVSTAALLSLLSVQLILSPVQGLYWFNGASFYILFRALALLALALGLRLLREGGLWPTVLLCLLALILGGGNFITALSCAILGVSAILLLALCARREWRRLLLPVLLLLASFALSVAAPGNAVRQARSTHEPQAIRAILDSFAAGARFSVEWMSLPIAGSLVLLGLLFWEALRDCRFRFRLPGLLSLYSYCLFSAMFCPTYYALGTTGDYRLLNIQFFDYLLLLALNLFYWLGWFRQRQRERRALLKPLLPAAALLCALCFALHLLGGSFSATMALGLLRSGEAREYAACGERRLAVLRDGSVRDAELEPFPVKPYVLYFDDITDDPDDWRNVSMAAYYHKDSVVLGRAAAAEEGRSP